MNLFCFQFNGIYISLLCFSLNSHFPKIENFSRLLIFARIVISIYSYSRYFIFARSYDGQNLSEFYENEISVKVLFSHDIIVANLREIKTNAKISYLQYFFCIIIKTKISLLYFQKELTKQFHFVCFYPVYHTGNLCP